MYVLTLTLMLNGDARHTGDDGDKYVVDAIRKSTVYII